MVNMSNMNDRTLWSYNGKSLFIPQDQLGKTHICRVPDNIYRQGKQNFEHHMVKFGTPDISFSYLENKVYITLQDIKLKAGCFILVLELQNCIRITSNLLQETNIYLNIKSTTETFLQICCSFYSFCLLCCTTLTSKKAFFLVPSHGMLCAI